jgi:hypothetical protein
VEDSCGPVIFPARWCGPRLSTIEEGCGADERLLRYSTRSCISRTRSARPILTADLESPQTATAPDREEARVGLSDGGSEGK